MKTLTLENIAPYLPYRTLAKMIRQDDNEAIISELTISDFDFLINKNNAKPILYPIEALKELMPNNDVCYISYLWHNVISTDSDSFDKNVFYENCELGNVNHLPIKVYNQLIQWRFDIFGLIEKGLAIPVTNEFNPYKQNI